MNTLTRTLVPPALLVIAAAGAVALAVDSLPAPPKAQPLDIARLNAKGKLERPADLANWIFLGTSLGMGYNPGSFNAAHPGQFQVVLMAPTAYRYSVEPGSYAPGSMFLLSFYDADTQVRSINQHGFTQADLTNYEIHLTTSGSGQDAHAFYTFGASDTEGGLVPPGNACVRCHTQHGAFEGTFAQFYPAI